MGKRRTRPWTLAALAVAGTASFAACTSVSGLSGGMDAPPDGAAALDVQATADLDAATSAPDAGAAGDASDEDAPRPAWCTSAPNGAALVVATASGTLSNLVANTTSLFWVEDKRRIMRASFADCAVAKLYSASEDITALAADDAFIAWASPGYRYLPIAPLGPAGLPLFATPGDALFLVGGNAYWSVAGGFATCAEKCPSDGDVATFIGVPAFGGLAVNDTSLFYFSASSGHYDLVRRPLVAGGQTLTIASDATAPHLLTASPSYAFWVDDVDPHTGAVYYSKASNSQSTKNSPLVTQSAPYTALHAWHDGVLVATGHDVVYVLATGGVPAPVITAAPDDPAVVELATVAGGAAGDARVGWLTEDRHGVKVTAAP